jgi:hypothetical protein
MSLSHGERMAPQITESSSEDTERSQIASFLVGFVAASRTADDVLKLGNQAAASTARPRRQAL